MLELIIAKAFDLRVREHGFNSKLCHLLAMRFWSWFIFLCVPQLLPQFFKKNICIISEQHLPLVYGAATDAQ